MSDMIKHEVMTIYGCVVEYHHKKESMARYSKSDC